MGIIIKASAITEWTEDQSSVDLVAKAGLQCIADAGVNPEDIGLLINLGVYREENMVEPAIAALIQKKMKLNNDTVRDKFNKTTFSFDLLNGTCGFLNAIQIIHAILMNKRTQYAIIVGGDIHPSRKIKADFPYSSYGSAVLLELGNDNNGFQNIMMKTSKNDDYPGVKGGFNMLNMGGLGRTLVKVEVDADYPEKLHDFAVGTIKEYAQSENIDLSGIKLIVSEPSEGFCKKVAKTIGSDENSAVSIYDKYGNPHTSSLLIGYHLAVNNGSLKSGDKLLFTGASSGLTAACGLYII